MVDDAIATADDRLAAGRGACVVGAVIHAIVAGLLARLPNAVTAEGPGLTGGHTTVVGAVTDAVVTRLVWRLDLAIPAAGTGVPSDAQPP